MSCLKNRYDHILNKLGNVMMLIPDIIPTTEVSSPLKKVKQNLTLMSIFCFS